MRININDVKKGLEICTGIGNRCYYDCPYRDGVVGGCMRRLMRDATQIIDYTSKKLELMETLYTIEHHEDPEKLYEENEVYWWQYDDQCI